MALVQIVPVLRDYFNQDLPPFPPPPLPLAVDSNSEVAGVVFADAIFYTAVFSCVAFAIWYALTFPDVFYFISKTLWVTSHYLRFSNRNNGRPSSTSFGRPSFSTSTVWGHSSRPSSSSRPHGRRKRSTLWVHEYEDEIETMDLLSRVLSSQVEDFLSLAE